MLSVTGRWVHKSPARGTGRLGEKIVVRRSSESRYLSMMICRHGILIASCVACLAEGAAQTLNVRPDSERLQTVGIYWPRPEFPHPDPPTEDGGSLFHVPPVSASASSRSAGFLAEDADWVVTNLLRPSSFWTHTVPQPSYYSEEIPVWQGTPS